MAVLLCDQSVVVLLHTFKSLHKLRHVRCTIQGMHFLTPQLRRPDERPVQGGAGRGHSAVVHAVDRVTRTRGTSGQLAACLLHALHAHRRDVLPRLILALRNSARHHTHTHTHQVALRDCDATAPATRTRFVAQQSQTDNGHCAPRHAEGSALCDSLPPLQFCFPRGFISLCALWITIIIDDHLL